MARVNPPFPPAVLNVDDLGREGGRKGEREGGREDECKRPWSVLIHHSRPLW